MNDSSRWNIGILGQIMRGKGRKIAAGCKMYICFYSRLVFVFLVVHFCGFSGWCLLRVCCKGWVYFS